MWRDLRLTALAEAPYAFGARLADWLGDGDREDRWRARLEIPGSYNVMAVFEGVPGGMASGMPTDDDGVAELISMWVAPAARGRGVGDELIRTIERWAHAGSARVLRLSVAEGNDRAVGLYQRHGFGFTGAADLMPDGLRKELVMEKILALPRTVQSPRRTGSARDSV